MLSRRNLFASVALSFTIMASGCMRMGEPTSDERAQLTTWSKVVSDQDRTDVRREADTHTEWMERKKTQWMIGEYRSRYEKARAKQARRAAETRNAATQRAAATAPTQP
ncbi:MAG: hypothetical protein H7Z14_01985 [Anaerolineae bacterium]|nr:hypothetical protein [Phycisphaerae bacterium]